MQLLIILCPFLLTYIVSALQDSVNNVVAFGRNYSMVLVGGGLDDNNKVLKGIFEIADAKSELILLL